MLPAVLLSSTDTKHDDIILDLAVNFYGDRIATCSADSYVKVWDRVDSEWRISATWKSTRGPVSHVAWAPPEFGQLIAVSALNNVIFIEEDDTDSEKPRWLDKHIQSDQNENITSIGFGPPHIGLVFAMCTATKGVKVFFCNDLLNFREWDMVGTIQDPCGSGYSCFAWCSSAFTERMIAVCCRQRHTVKIVAYNSRGGWEPITEMLGHSEDIIDIAWAPESGRSYHLLASVSSDALIIWKLEINSNGDAIYTRYVIKNVDGCFPWRLRWNVTGTILAGSYDDGTVRMWKMNQYNFSWVQFSAITPDTKSVK